MLNLSLDVSDLVLNSSGLLGDLLLLNSLSFDFVLDKSDSLFGFLSDTRRLLFLKLGLVDFSNLGSGNRLLLLLSEDFLSLLNESSLFLSLGFINGLSLDFNLSNQLGSLNLEVIAAYLISLSLIWILGLLSIDASSLRFNFLIFSSNLLLLIDLLKLVIFLNDNGLLFFNFSSKGHLSVGGALTVANLAACSGGISLSKIDVGNNRNGASIVSLILGGSGRLLRDGFDFTLRSHQGMLLNPVVHN